MQEQIIIEDDPKEIPRPRPAARGFIRAGAFDEEGEFEGFDDKVEEEGIIKLLEHTTEAENFFMVSFVSFLIQLLNCRV